MSKQPLVAYVGTIAARLIGILLTVSGYARFAQPTRTEQFSCGVSGLQEAVETDLARIRAGTTPRKSRRAATFE